MENSNSSGVTFNDFQVETLEKSPYIKPYQISFKQNGIQRSWHTLNYSDSVSALLHDVEKDVIILLRKFSPPVFLSKCLEKQKLNDPFKIDFTNTKPEDGLTYELCSGFVDKTKTELENIKEKILKKAGYDVPLNEIHKINTIRTGTKHTSFYARVSNSMFKGSQNVHDDYAEIFELPVKDIKLFSKDETKEKPQGLLLTLNWFLYERMEAKTDLLNSPS